jgi:hypothetical protein
MRMQIAHAGHKAQPVKPSLLQKCDGRRRVVKVKLLRLGRRLRPASHKTDVSFAAAAASKVTICGMQGIVTVYHKRTQGYMPLHSYSS